MTSPLKVEFFVVVVFDSFVSTLRGRAQRVCEDDINLQHVPLSLLLQATWI